MVQSYAWGPRGDRLLNALHNCYWRRPTYIASLCNTGLAVSLALDWPMTGGAFLAYVGQFLALNPGKGDMVVLYNLAAHTVADVREAIRARGASPFHLPIYSSDLNPIEDALAMPKALL